MILMFKLLFKLIFGCYIIISYARSEVEKIEFMSANPFSLKDIIVELDTQKLQLVTAILEYPSNLNKGKIPLVIGVAGSYGWGDHHLRYLKMYRDMGIATLMLESFSSRNVTSTVGTQNTVTTAMIVLDSYKALEKISENTKIDIEKVAITGWSLGGGVVLLTAWKPIIEAINSNLPVDNLMKTINKSIISSNFVASLELSKNGFIDLKQDESFGNIYIKFNQNG